MTGFSLSMNFLFARRKGASVDKTRVRYVSRGSAVSNGVRRCREKRTVVPGWAESVERKGGCGLYAGGCREDERVCRAG